MVDRCELVQAPSRVMAFASARRTSVADVTGSGIAGLFNPTGDLPYADHERDLICLSAPEGVPVHMINPGKDSSTVLGELASYGIWHFATHGWFGLDGFLVVGNRAGPRSSKDVRTHSPSEDLVYRTPRIAARLVVLTVCESALNDIKESPNEMLALPSAFLAAGSPGVIATSWPVDDLATAILVARFYHGHFALGLSPPAALRAAQRWLRDARPDRCSHFYVSFKRRTTARAPSTI